MQGGEMVGLALVFLGAGEEEVGIGSSGPITSPEVQISPANMVSC